MIEKQYLYFKTKDGYRIKKNDIKAGSIVFIEETKELITHGTSFTSSNIIDEAILIKKGVINGIAPLDDSGLIPSDYLPSDYFPSYADVVLEYETLTAFPEEGESGKIYIALDTNLTYRWGDSTYVEISKGITLGETDNTAYEGSKGKALETKVNQLTSTTEGLSSSLTTIDNNLNELNTKVDNLNGLTDRVDTIDSNLSDLTNRVDNLDELNTRVDTLDGNFDTLNSNFTTLNDKIGEHTKIGNNVSIGNGVTIPENWSPISSYNIVNSIKIQYFESVSSNWETVTQATALTSASENCRVIYNAETKTLQLLTTESTGTGDWVNSRGKLYTYWADADKFGEIKGEDWSSGATVVPSSDILYLVPNGESAKLYMWDGEDMIAAVPIYIAK